MRKPQGCGLTDREDCPTQQDYVLLETGLVTCHAHIINSRCFITLAFLQCKVEMRTVLFFSFDR